jgi:outer membrane protein
MKRKISLLAGALIIALGLNAQVEQGKILIGGSSNLRFSSNTMSSEVVGVEDSDSQLKTSEFSFEPQVGYFVIDGLAVGIDLSYISSKSKWGDMDWSDPSTALGIGLFGKYYVGDTNIKPFAQANIGFMSISYGDDDTDKYSGLAFGGVLGAAYFINEYVGLEMGIGYAFAKIKNKDNKDEIGKESGLGVNIGIVVAF